MLKSGAVSIARGTAFNVAGFAVPALVGLVCFPFLMRGLGIERFGMLALSWTVIGYAGLFDLGLGRALTRFMAQAGEARDHDVERMAMTGTAFLLAFGLAVGMAGWLAAETMADLIQVSAALRPEVVASLR
ncbi:MAG: oligosaccharide flippase family protein, partial [Rhodospirillales bacterium]|nr:oligosaccharide flippase family protein [Rhodospirillales bacterium]